MMNITSAMENITTAVGNSTTALPYFVDHSTSKSSIFDLFGKIDSSKESGDQNRFIDILGGIDLEEYKKASDVCDIAIDISNIYLWVLFAIGVPGNGLVIITVLTMQAISPATFFVALLAFFDGSTLILKTIYHQLALHDITIGDVGCKFGFLPVYLATMANWMLILICAERFVSVCYPLKKVYLFTKKRSYISAAVLVLAHLAIFVPIFATMRVSKVWGKRCHVGDEYYDFWRNYWFYINGALFLFIPFLFIFILTVCIIRGLHISRLHRRSLLRKGSGGGTGNERATMNNERLIAETERTERTITIMMILAASLFLVFSLPSFVYYIAYYVNSSPEFINMACQQSLTKARWQLFEQIQRLLVDSTHALNFFIYFFTAQRFRHHLFKLLTCKICRKKKYDPRYQNTYSTSLSTSTRVNHSVCPGTPTSMHGRNSIQPMSPIKP